VVFEISRVMEFPVEMLKKISKGLLEASRIYEEFGKEVRGNRGEEVSAFRVVTSVWVDVLNELKKEVDEGIKTGVSVVLLRMVSKALFEAAESFGAYVERFKEMPDHLTHADVSVVANVGVECRLFADELEGKIRGFTVSKG
jgi:sugar-specific transcriptional regulator TrmB